MTLVKFIKRALNIYNHVSELDDKQILAEALVLKEYRPEYSLSEAVSLATKFIKEYPEFYELHYEILDNYAKMTKSRFNYVYQDSI